MNVNSQLFKFLRDVKYVVTSKWSPQTGMSKRYPKVVQLPMTYCATLVCDVQHLEDGLLERI
jgi:hypothetical protein